MVSIKEEFFAVGLRLAEQALKAVDEELDHLREVQTERAPETARDLVASMWPTPGHDKLVTAVNQFFYGPLAPYHVGRLKWALEVARNDVNNGDWFMELVSILKSLYDDMGEKAKKECRGWAGES